MIKLINGTVRFIWSFLNLFLIYHVTISIASPDMWNVEFINRETLPFTTYWALTFMLGVSLAPTLCIIAFSTEFGKNNQTELYKFFQMGMITVVILFCWFVAWAFSFVKDASIFQ